MKKTLCFFCGIFFILSNISFAQSTKVDSLIALSKKETNDSLKSRLCYKVSWEYILQSENDKALLYAKQSLLLANKSNFKFGQAVSNQYLGTIYSTYKKNEEAKKYFTSSLNIWKELNDVIGEVDVYLGLSNISAFETKTEESVMYLNLALKKLELLNDKSRMGGILNSIGNIYYNKSEYKKAFDNYYNGLKCYEAANDLNGTACTYVNISNVLTAERNYPEALKKCYKALKIFQEVNNKQQLALLYSNMGIIFFEQKKYAQALDKYSKSLAMRKEINDEIGMADVYTNIGNVYYVWGTEEAKKGKFEKLNKALLNNQMALDIRKSLGDKRGMGLSYQNVAGIYTNFRKYPLALEFYEKARLLCIETGDKLTLKGVYEGLYVVDTLLGDYKSGFYNALRVSKIKDSLFNTESSELINEINTKYETEKKDKEITILNKDKKLNELEIENQKSAAKQRTIFLYFSFGILAVIIVFSYLLFKRFKLEQKQKQIIEIKEIETHKQKELIEEKQKEIIDSINYAKRIQYTVIAHDDFLKENIPNYFVYFNPKDIVSGDFYWATKQGSKFYLAVCDSTGHGVPGAFMSLLNIGFLTEAINEKNILEPNKVFNHVRERLIDNMSKEGQKDGFDGILLCIDLETKEVTYAAGHNAPVLVSNGELFYLEADKMPIGIGERKESFKLFNIDIKQNDTLYLYTDGYADQFGGPKGKKFKYKQLNDLILAHCKSPLKEQKEALMETFVNWRGDLEQVDDVCVIAIKF